MSFDSKLTGLRLYSLRTLNKMTQTELAERLEVKRQIISYYETGSRMPSLEHIILLCEIFDTTSDYLLGITDVSTTDMSINAICSYTGLTEKAIEELRHLYGLCKISPPDFEYLRSTINFLIEQEGEGGISALTYIANYLTATVQDLDEPIYNMNGEVLKINADNIPQKLLLIMAENEYITALEEAREMVQKGEQQPKWQP